MNDDFWKRPPYVPCHDELFGLAVALIPQPREAPFSLLDIGSGSGAFAALVARGFPAARLALLETDVTLLRAALARLGDASERTQAFALDWTEEDLPGRHDVVSAVLSLHGLDGEDRAALYSAAFDALGRNGVFLLVARIRAATPSVDHAYRTAWQQQVLGAGGDAALVAEHLADLKVETLGTLADEQAALAAAGFAEVNCWYQNLSYALLTGVRPH